MAQRILVAEDEMIVAFDLCETVEEAGFEVEGPYPGVSDAMLAYQKAKPDLAILDIELSDGNAYAFAKKLEEENIPVIFHSGRVSGETVAQQFPEAVTLEKPCPPAQMIDAMTKALQPA